jgi:hypothetical protein
MFKPPHAGLTHLARKSLYTILVACDFPPVSRIAGQFSLAVMINKVAHRYHLFPLTVSSLVD